jgi:hypothetical protein
VNEPSSPCCSTRRAARQLETALADSRWSRQETREHSIAKGLSLPILLSTALHYCWPSREDRVDGHSCPRDLGFRWGKHSLRHKRGTLEFQSDVSLPPSQIHEASPNVRARNQISQPTSSPRAGLQELVRGLYQPDSLAPPHSRDDIPCGNIANEKEIGGRFSSTRSSHCALVAWHGRPV